MLTDSTRLPSMWSHATFETAGNISISNATAPFAVCHSLHQIISLKKEKQTELVIAEIFNESMNTTRTCYFHFSKNKDLAWKFLKPYFKRCSGYNEKEGCLEFLKINAAEDFKVPSFFMKTDLLSLAVKFLSAIKIKIQEQRLDYKEDLICPISMNLFDDPCTDSCGHTFNRKEIEEWLESNHTCPLSRNPITKEGLVQNLSIKDRVKKAKENFPIPTPGLISGKSIQENDKRAQTFLNSAKEFMDGGEYTEALKQYKKLLLNTNSGEMYAPLPPFIEKQKKWIEAAYSYVCLAILLAHENKVDEASAILKKALSLLPEKEVAFAEAQGDYYSTKGKIRKALHYYGILRESYTEAQIDEASEYYEKAIVSDPNNLIHYIRLISVCGELSRGIKVYLSIISQFGHTHKELAQKIYRGLLRIGPDRATDLQTHHTYLTVLNKEEHPHEVMTIYQALSSLYKQTNETRKANYYKNKLVNFWTAKKYFQSEIYGPDTVLGGGERENICFPYSQIPIKAVVAPRMPAGGWPTGIL